MIPTALTKDSLRAMSDEDFGEVVARALTLASLKLAASLPLDLIEAECIRRSNQDGRRRAPPVLSPEKRAAIRRARAIRSAQRAGWWGP